MAWCCPRDNEPMTRSEGSEDSGTGIMLPIHLQQGVSAQLSWSAFHKQNGRVFKAGRGRASGRWTSWASAHSSARLWSFPQGPGQSQAKICGLARVGFLLSLTASGWMEMEMSGWMRHCMSSALENSMAWGRYLCFARDRRGRRRLWLGMKIMVWRPGWGLRERTPAIAASAAARVQS